VYFSPKSFANFQIPATGRVVDILSADVVKKLAAWVNQETQPIGLAAPPNGPMRYFKPLIPFLNTDIPIYAADTTKLQPVTISGGGWPELAAAQQPLLQQVPVPDIALGGPTPDLPAVIVGSNGDLVYEFWQFKRDSVTKACTASGAGIFQAATAKASNYNEYCCLPQSMQYLGSQWGGQASGFSYLAGIITCDEWKARNIPHAIAMQVPWGKATWFSSPAQRTDGKDTHFDAIPYGARFMLPADFDMDAYQANRALTEPGYRLWAQDRAICKAWMNYGLFAVDQTGSGVGLVAENVRGWRARNSTTEDPYANWDRQSMMERLPWEELQMMVLDSRRRP
jgi:hypothetical protein